jgi:hypothetical protein
MGSQVNNGLATLDRLGDLFSVADVSYNELRPKGLEVLSPARTEIVKHANCVAPFP